MSSSFSPQRSLRCFHYKNITGSLFKNQILQKMSSMGTERPWKPISERTCAVRGQCPRLLSPEGVRFPNAPRIVHPSLCTEYTAHIFSCQVLRDLLHPLSLHVSTLLVPHNLGATALWRDVGVLLGPGAPSLLPAPGVIPQAVTPKGKGQGPFQGQVGCDPAIFEPGGRGELSSPCLRFLLLAWG